MCAQSVILLFLGEKVCLWKGFLFVLLYGLNMVIHSQQWPWGLIRHVYHVVLITVCLLNNSSCPWTQTRIRIKWSCTVSEPLTHTHLNGKAIWTLCCCFSSYPLLTFIAMETISTVESLSCWNIVTTLDLYQATSFNIKGCWHHRLCSLTIQFWHRRCC